MSSCTTECVVANHGGARFWEISLMGGVGRAPWLTFLKSQPHHDLIQCILQCADFWQISVMAGVGGAPILVHGKGFMGHFLEGKKHGIGHHVFYDGSYYKGEYQLGVYHGAGVVSFSHTHTHTHCLSLSVSCARALCCALSLSLCSSTILLWIRASMNLAFTMALVSSISLLHTPTHTLSVSLYLAHTSYLSCFLSLAL